MSHEFISATQPHTPAFYWFSPLSFFIKAICSAHTKHLLWTRHHNNSLQPPVSPSIRFISHTAVTMLESCRRTSNGFLLPIWSSPALQHDVQCHVTTLSGPLTEPYRVRVRIKEGVGLLASQPMGPCTHLHGCSNRFLGCVFSLAVEGSHQTCSNPSSASCQTLSKSLHLFEFLFPTGHKTIYGRDC